MTTSRSRATGGTYDAGTVQTVMPSLTADAGLVLAAVPGMPEWLSAESLAKAGLLVLLVVVFVETGLLVGFFLPGDSLLFTAGLLVAQDQIELSIWWLVLTLPLAAIAGDQTGYTIGRVTGPRIFNRPDSRIFQQEYVDKSYAYFERYGGRTIVLARFVPIVRTFAPVVAGVSRMSRRTFTGYNVLGGVLWAAGVPLLGYYLGRVELIADNLEPVILIIVAISVLPIVVEVLRARREHRSGPTPGRDLPADLPRD
jgi:membrane-associated protein